MNTACIRLSGDVHGFGCSSVCVKVGEKYYVLFSKCFPDYKGHTKCQLAFILRPSSSLSLSC